MKQQNPTVISIVLPIYNTKKFLMEAVESVTTALKKAKETEEFKSEVLLIDNGSKDGSLELAKKLAEEEPNLIKVDKCPTSSAGAVRNFGLNRAKGEYVWFIDSDDFIAEEAVAGILDAIRKYKKPDVILIGARKTTEEGKEIPGAVLPAIKTSLNDSEIKEEVWVSKFIRYGLAPWQVIARREFLIQNGLFYDEEMIHEDMALISSYVLYTRKVVAVEKPVLFYRQRNGSVLHDGEWSKAELDILPALELLSQRFEKVKKFKRHKAELEYFYIWNLLDDAARKFKKFPEGRRHFSDLRTALKKRFPAWRKNRYFRECPLAVRARCETAYFGVVW